MTRESIVHFSIFLNQKQDLEHYLAHELNTVSVDVSENIELKNAFYLHFLVTSDPNLMSPSSKILVTFTVDRTFSISCIKSVTKLWIVPGGRQGNISKACSPLMSNTNVKVFVVVVICIYSKTFRDCSLKQNASPYSVQICQYSQSFR